MRKITYFIFVTLLFGCKNTTADDSKLVAVAPMNPVITYLHKSELALRGPVKTVGEETYNKEGFLLSNAKDLYSYYDDKILVKVEDYIYTYFKNKAGKIVKCSISGIEHNEYFTYDTNGLLASDYGTEEGVNYKTVYVYDIEGRIIKSSYTYGSDPVANTYYNYEELSSNLLQITISYDNKDQKEVYVYKEGIMQSSTQEGITINYTYEFDSNGNWTSQTLSDGGTTVRKITYFN